MSEKQQSVRDRIASMGEHVQQRFAANERVLSFAGYLEVVERSPRVQLRNAALYMRDMFDYYGTEDVSHPTGKVRRFKLFDAPWDGDCVGLVGQERVQNAIYRVLCNFVRQGRVDRFILLHGPNGSSKSTVSDMLARAMEDYCQHEEGALYTFSWVFPNQGAERAGIGFGDVAKKKIRPDDSYAHLDETAVDARVSSSTRDHPLLLIPKDMRRELLTELAKGLDGNYTIPDYLWNGDLCQRSKEIYEALLAAYDGDYLRVLRHVQVERFYVSRRYRLGAARVEPQLAVDARMQQVTADRSLAALPAALQNVALYESEGQLVRGNRGMIDFPDLFKRPIEAFKYLLIAVEDGRVALDQSNLFLDMVFIGSANEMLLNAFMQSPEWMSFKARMELIRVPYLLDFHLEQRIYDLQVTETEVGKAIAPHATEVAALWAVLGRMQLPQAESFEEPVATLVKKLAARDKAMLYAEKRLPEGVTGESAKMLRAAIGDIYRTTDNAIIYEGRIGPSAREVKTAIMNAAQNPQYPCLSPEAVLQELALLVKETTLYEYLRQEVKSGYCDYTGFLSVARSWYLDHVDSEVREAMGLVEESRYGELFDRYVNNVTHFVRREKLRNEITGRLEDPDVRLMAQVEEQLDQTGDAEVFRQAIMTKIGAWSVDNPGARPLYGEIFGDYFDKLRKRYFHQQRQRVERVLRHSLQVMAKDESGLDAEEISEVRAMLDRLREQHGYREQCAQEVIRALVKYRYSSN